MEGDRELCSLMRDSLIDSRFSCSENTNLIKLSFDEMTQYEEVCHYRKLINDVDRTRMCFEGNAASEFESYDLDSV